MFVLVVGGGKVGYYLTKELIESGHEVALMEKDRARAQQITDEIGSVVIAAGRLRGQVPQRGRRQPRRHRGGRHRRRRGQPRDLPDGEAPLRRAADDRAREQPQERGAVPAPRRRRDHQPDPDGPGLDRAGHPGPRAAPPRGARRRRARDHRGAPPAGLARHRQDRARPVRAQRLLAVRRHPRGRADAAADRHGARGGRQGHRHRPARLRGRAPASSSSGSPPRPEAPGRRRPAARR